MNIVNKIIDLQNKGNHDKVFMNFGNNKLRDLLKRYGLKYELEISLELEDIARKKMQEGGPEVYSLSKESLNSIKERLAFRPS